MPRRPYRRFVVALLTGALTVTTAWAGIGLSPVGNEVVETDALDAVVVEETTAEASAPLAALAGGQFLAGAAKVSLEPRPRDYGGTWQKSGCATLGDDALQGVLHVPDFRLTWPERPGCLYMGGYGIGPMNPIYGWDQEYGLWVRTVVISDGADELVLSIIDATSYFGDYNKMCDSCGAFELAESLGARHGFDPAGFMLASTHSHTAPDLIGGWGGVPPWYMEQVEDSIRTSVARAFANLQPANVQAGEVFARQFNGERRDFYRSAEDPTMSWLRVTGAATPFSTIATMGAFAAHPVTADEGAGIANADFPGPFSKRLEERFGGVGMFFQTGLGNMSPRGSTESMGNGLAALVPDSGAAVQNNNVTVRNAMWRQPSTNIPLTALGVAGFFDRHFALPVPPPVVREGKHDTRKCTSASPFSVKTGVNVARVGELVITGAPGETFANLSNTLEERFPQTPVFALAQVNDGMGYIVQSFETDHPGRQGLGFVGEPLAEYEDAYSIDACFGDAVLEKTLGLL